MSGGDETDLEGALDTTSLRSFSMMLGGLSGTGSARPVGLDTDAISNTLNGLGRSMNAGVARPAGDAEPPGK
jgi:hypothetical protein